MKTNTNHTNKHLYAINLQASNFKKADFKKSSLQASDLKKERFAKSFKKAFLILFLSCLAIPAFSAPNDDANLTSQSKSSQTEEAKNPYGWFFGVGLNMGVDRVEYNRKRKNFFTPGGGLKVGGYVNVNSWLSVRSYLGYDVDINPLFNSDESLFNQPGRKYYILYNTYSLNFDLIFNVYTVDKVTVGLILGGEVNLMSMTFDARLESSYQKSPIPYYAITSRLKFGARAMLGENKQYGVEVIERIGQNLGNQFATIKTTTNNFVTTVNFVMEM